MIILINIILNKNTIKNSLTLVVNPEASQATYKHRSGCRYVASAPFGRLLASSNELGNRCPFQGCSSVSMHYLSIPGRSRKGIHRSKPSDRTLFPFQEPVSISAASSGASPTGTQHPPLLTFLCCDSRALTEPLRRI